MVICVSICLNLEYKIDGSRAPVRCGKSVGIANLLGIMLILEPGPKMANFSESRPFAKEVCCDSCTERCLNSLKCQPVTMIYRSLFAPSQGPTECSNLLLGSKGLKPRHSVSILVSEI